jgi:hypothetical protein
MMKNWFTAMLLIVTLFVPICRAVTPDALIGTWRLVSATDMNEKGERSDSYGRDPSGLITYTADGRMMALITNGGRKLLSVSDWISAPASERAEAFATMLAYAGSYTVAGDNVTHHVEVSWMQTSVNADLVRRVVKIEGDRLYLAVEQPFLKGGRYVRQELVWERVRPSKGK